jgi:hypothetical protein
VVSACQEISGKSLSQRFGFGISVCGDLRCFPTKYRVRHKPLTLGKIGYLRSAGLRRLRNPEAVAGQQIVVRRAERLCTGRWHEGEANVTIARDGATGSSPATEAAPDACQ